MAAKKARDGHMDKADTVATPTPAGPRRKNLATLKMMKMDTDRQMDAMSEEYMYSYEAL